MFIFLRNLMFYFFILFFIVSPIVTFAQSARIIKIIDSNLFELENGKRIKLAGIDVPNLFIENPDLQNIAYKAFKHAEYRLLKKSFTFSYPPTTKTDSEYTLVFIKRKFPLATIDFTEEFLQNGFGKFIKNYKSGDTTLYKTAEQEAKQNKKEIWKFTNELADTLDKNLCGVGVINDSLRTSILNFHNTLPFLRETSPAGIVIVESVASPVFGILGGLLGIGGGAAIGELAGAKNFGAIGYVLLGGYLGYLGGCSYGTYFVAKQNNMKDVTYGYTFLSGFIGGIAGMVTAAVLNPDKNLTARISLFALPVIATIVYANLIAPDKANGGYNVSYIQKDLMLNKNHFSHYDFYNSTKLAEVNLLKIFF